MSDHFQMSTDWLLTVRAVTPCVAYTGQDISRYFMHTLRVHGPLDCSDMIFKKFRSSFLKVRTSYL